MVSQKYSPFQPKDHLNGRRNHERLGRHCGVDYRGEMQLRAASRGNHGDSKGRGAGTSSWIMPSFRRRSCCMKEPDLLLTVDSCHTPTASVWADATLEFSTAVAASSGPDIGKMSRKDYGVLLARVEAARLTAENARIALQLHRRQHRC
jgi:hypothetical protein